MVGILDSEEWLAYTDATDGLQVERLYEAIRLRLVRS